MGLLQNYAGKTKRLNQFFKYFRVGVSLGSFIGGLMFERWTGRTTFRFFGISALLMCMIYKGVMMTLDRRFEPVSQHQGMAMFMQA